MDGIRVEIFFQENPISNAICKATAILIITPFVNQQNFFSSCCYRYHHEICGMLSDKGYLIKLWFVFVYIQYSDLLECNFFENCPRLSTNGLLIDHLDTQIASYVSYTWKFKKWWKHYNDVIMSAMASKTPASPLFTEPFIQAQIKENGDRWIPRTKGQ